MKPPSTGSRCRRRESVEDGFVVPYKDPERQRTYFRVHYQKNRERILARKRRYYQAHRESKIAYVKAYNLANTGKVYARKRAYHRAHPDMARAARARHRAYKRGVDSTLTAPQWRAIIIAYKSRCAYCGVKQKKLTQDHVTPLSRGGFHAASNVVPACLSCNQHKHAGPPPLIPAVRLLC